MSEEVKEDIPEVDTEEVRDQLSDISSENEEGLTEESIDEKNDPEEDMEREN